MSRATSLTTIGNSAFNNCDALTKITIPEKVTSIGENAFCDCSNLATVDMSRATSLTTIGGYAFYNCDALTKITIPEKVTTIGSYAFYHSDKLATVDMSNAKSLTSIGIYAFYGCDALTKIAIPENVTTIGSYAFQSCSNLATVDMSSAKSLTSIGSYAFANNTNLKTADLSNAESLTTINDYAFSSCANLEKVDLSGANNLSYVNTKAFFNCPKLKSFGSSGGKAIYSADGKTLRCYLAVSPDTAFTIPSTVTTIANYAFCDCDNLKQVTIPSSVTSIGSYAFNGCDNLAKIDFRKATGLTYFDSYAFSGCPKLATIDLSATSLTTIGSSAFYDNDYLTEITLPESVTSIGYQAFYDCDKLKKVNLKKARNLTTIGDYAFYSCNKLTDIDLEHAENLKNIYSYAFYDDDALTEIAIPASVETISSSAFQDCSNLEKVDLSRAKNLTSIFSGAFWNCQKLKTIDFENATSLNTISSYAFAECKELTKIIMPESIVTIGYQAFQNCTKLATVDLRKAKNLKTISGQAFCNCSALTGITIPESVETIAVNAFSGCKSLTEITIPESVKTLGYYAFHGCYNLKKVDMSKAKNLTTIETRTFWNCSNLTELYLPESISTVQDNAFEGSINLNYTVVDGGRYLGNKSNPYLVLVKATSTDISECRIKNGTQVIANNAFYECSNLTSVSIPNSVTSIGEAAFQHCSNLSQVKIPNSVKTVGNSAFYNCYSLHSIDVPQSVTSIGDNAFQGLRNINYYGTAGSETSTWSALMRNGKYNGGGYEKGDFVFIDEECTRLRAYIGNGANIVLPETTKSIESHAFIGCSTLKSVTIPDGVETIGGLAFQGCNNLKTLTIGSGLTTVGSGAFSCFPIETLNYNSSAIGAQFMNNSTLKTVNVGDKVTNIAYSSFSGCSNLQTVNLSNAKKLEVINENAFSNCSALTEINIPESVVSIYNNAFSGCPIETLTFNTNYIGGRFKNKTSLKNITVGDKVTSIPSSAFSGCSNITSVVTNSNANFSNSGILFVKDGIRYKVLDKNSVEVVSNGYSGRVEIPETVMAGNTFKVRGIGDKAFKDCSGLVSIDLSKDANLEYIGWQAFSNCDGLTKITIPESVFEIDNYAFDGCDNLETVDMSNAKNLEYIGESTFRNCSSLSRFIIPASVTVIGDYAFSGCTSISPILCEAESQPSGWYYNWNYPNYHRIIWHYNKLKVNLSVNNSEWGTVSGSGTYTYGEDVHIKATPAKGCAFVGWNDDTPFDEFTVPAMEDIDITAIFAKRVQVGKNTVYAKNEDYFNCVFTPEKSAYYRIYSNSDSDTYGYLYDGGKNCLTEDDDNGENYNFEITYYLDGGETYYLGVMFLSDDKEGNINFTIEEVKPYIVSATAKNGKVEGTGAYYYGVVASLHAVPDEGYHFVKWSDGETSSWYHIDVYNNVKLTAEFAINEYDITGSVSSDYGTVGGTGTYAHGSEVSLIAKPNKGYEFIRWGDGNTDNPRKFKVENTGDYYAVVIPKTYNIETSGSHVSVDIWGDCYYGNTVEIEAWPEYNYHFKEWRDSKGRVISTDNPLYYTVASDEKIRAVVEGDEFTISTSMDNGTVQGGGTYNYGSTVTLSATADPGYKFAGWADAVQTATRTITVSYNANYTAYTMPIDYSVVVTTSDAAKGTVSSDAGSPIRYGDVVNISATPTGNYKFVRWSDGNTSASRSITIERDLNLTAVFSDEILYTITATAGANGSVIGGGRYAEGETALLTAIANTGYHFVKWSTGSTDATTSVKVTGDKSLSAEFAVNTYTVSVTAGANGTVTGGGAFEFGAPATITATAAAGYHFAGWSDGSADANRTFNVSADLDLKAEFAINTYSVKATAKNGKVEGTGTYSHGTEATLTATAATGYHFSQWSDGNTTNPRKATVTSDMEFAAEFEVNTYEITAAAQNGTVSGAGTYNYGAMAALTATANTGYHFTQWSDGVLSSSRSVFVSEDMKFTAEFAIDAYNVSAYAQNGSVEGAGYYNHGASATLTAKANEGYHFTQWSDGVKDKSRTETVLSSMSFEAEFEVNSFNITAAESANGVVSGAGTYSYGAMATLTAVANEGYHFAQWSDGLTSATRRLTVVEDAEFGATFEINSYEVKLSAENGTVSGAGTFEHGAEATISAKAAEHYHFARWSDGNTDNPRKLTVTKNRSLKAVFEADLFTIKVEAENGTIYGASSGFEFGAVATLTASPDLGYHFEKWSDGNTDNPRSVTIDATVLSNLDKPFTAIFEKNPSYVGIEESAAEEVSIYAYGNTIVVENAADDIFVYDAMGRMIVRETADTDRTEIQVEGTGVYVVKTGSVSKRVMIK